MLRIFVTLSFFALSFVVPDQSFRSQQLKYPRVREAKAGKDSLCRAMYHAQGISRPSNIFIRVFKEEGMLELWALKGKSYVKLHSYEICAASGEAGPKLRIGDGQVPEGFYKIDRFNPQSNFHLSLGINYPNQADRLRNKVNPGGDIFIHGNCVTIGCMPLTDEYIKELYWICVLAKDAGQDEIPVHIFPCRMNDANLKKLKTQNAAYSAFWDNIKTGYDYFESKKMLPRVTVNSSGKYSFR